MAMHLDGKETQDATYLHSSKVCHCMNEYSWTENLPHGQVDSKDISSGKEQYSHRATQLMYWKCTSYYGINVLVIISLFCIHEYSSGYIK